MTAAGKGKPVSATDADGMAIQDTMVALLARRKATEGFGEPSGSSTVYSVLAGWATLALRDDPAIRVARSVLDFESLLNDVDVETILVPAEIRMLKSVVVRACQRCGMTKTIFFEVGDE